VNMPKVARVIYNRLARGGPLQMDATVLYYLGMDGGTVTPTMLQTKSRTTRISIPASRPRRSAPFRRSRCERRCTRRSAPGSTSP